MAKVWHSKLPELLLDFVRLRCRGMLAAEFAAAALHAHPWGESEWRRIAAAINRVFSLHIQFEGLVNSKAARTTLPPLEVTVTYQGSAPFNPAYTFRFTGFGNNASAAAKIKPRLDELYALGVSSTPSDSADRPTAIRITLRYGTEGIAWEEYQRFVRAELQFQLGLISLSRNVNARVGTGQTEPSSNEQRLWDLRIRFTEFLRRFLEFARSGGGCKWYPHPFTVFFILPRANMAEPMSHHIRSGLFGFSYYLDDGQTEFIKRELRDVSLEHFCEGVRFPDGLCSRVYLQGSPAQSESAAALIHDYRSTTNSLAALELLILENSVLLEIPVYETGTVDALNAPDGPEMILCVSLPKASEEAVAGKPSRPVKHSRSSGTRGLPDAVDADQIARNIAAPRGSVLRAGEAQFVFEAAQRLISQYLSLAPRPGQYNLVGRSSAIQQVRSEISHCANGNEPVLICGDSGTGKELVAQAVHDNSRRGTKPMIAISGASIDKDLAEAKLFGHVKGSFTHAFNDALGLFEDADGSSLFLDEVGELTPLVQAKLLRVLEKKEVIPVGRNTPRSIVDVRLITATNRDLEKMVAAGEFREDLYFRLSVHKIVLPPLADRREDIPLLVEHFLAQIASAYGQRKKGIAAEALEQLKQRDWRAANVRELRNELTRAVARCEGAVIAPEHLTQQAKQTSEHALLPVHDHASSSILAVLSGATLDALMADAQKAIVLAAIEDSGGSLARAAQRLGLTVTKLSELKTAFDSEQEGCG